MSNYDNSHWSDSRFAEEYRDQADGYVPERRRLIEIARSLYRYFVRSDRSHRILDLGCGDGVMIQELLKVDASDF
jgi:SAM-dependent methyltransferase